MSDTPLLRFAVIDDSNADRRAFKWKMTAPEKPFMRNVDIDYLNAPLDSYDAYRSYDGTIIDQELGAVKGTDVVAAVHKYDWRIPMAIVTGSDPDALPPDVRDYADAIGFKHGVSRHKIDGEFGVLRGWMRGIARVREARARGYEQALHEIEAGLVPGFRKE